MNVRLGSLSPFSESPLVVCLAPETHRKSGHAGLAVQCHEATWRNRLFDHLVGAGAKVEASQPTGGFTGNQQNASLPTVPRVHSANVRLVVGLRSRPSGESWNNRQRRPEIGGLSQRGTAMTASDTSTKLRLDPPGPGSWEQDPVHFPRPMTRYFQETHPPSFKRGTNDFARFYGML